MADARIEARIRKWTPAIDRLLNALYGDAFDVDQLRDRLMTEVDHAVKVRRPSLVALDVAREVDPTWFQLPSMIGYVAYADRFAGTLVDVAAKLDYLDELHVKYFHLMKVLRSREGANDGGYAVVDYLDVDPVLGSWSDLESLADHLHERGISLCLDVVMNHTAYEHEWAAKARAGSQQHRDYYLMFPDRTMPDRYEASLPEVFPEMAPGNFTWDDDVKSWVWTTFNTYQWDLNYANPDVVVEMLRVMLGLANAGVDVLRLDAVAFTWKRLGTTCQNQIEAHYIAQLFRALLGIAAPGVLLKAEAIVAPSDLVPYLGAHRLQRHECQIAYHNQLMVMLWSSLATANAALATEALSSLPSTPNDATWINYVRCHDDIGWAVSDHDAGRVGVDGGRHRSFLASFYRGAFDGSFAEGAAFSSNADTGDERTCGMTASLTGLAAAVRRGEPIAIDQAVRRVELLYGVIYGFAGIPLIYMGDELGVESSDAYLDDDDLADDSRWMHRPPMSWTRAARRRDPATVEGRLFAWLSRLGAVRAEHESMSAGGSTFIHRLPDPAALGWERVHPRFGRMYGLANFAARTVVLPTDVLKWASLAEPAMVLSSSGVDVGTSGIVLPGYSVAWFVDGADQLM